MRTLITLIIGILFSTITYAQSTTVPRIAFYYAGNIPVDELSQFDQIVVDPGQISNDEIIKLKQYGGKVIAYVSVGESERWRDDYTEINKDLFMGVNKGWDSDIIDLTRPEWMAFLMERRFNSLSQRKFDGFFLDTLDSYQGVVEEKLWPEQEQGLSKIIQAISQQHPQAKIILNRGFPVLKDVHNIVHGVIAESLFARWDPIDKEYGYVKENDREWLLNKLNIVKEKYNIPVTVIDYLPPSKRKEARRVAKKIAELGFAPWVSTPELNYLGIGLLEVIPRKVLMLYNSTNQYLGDIYSASIHTAAAMPVEYLGYVPVYFDISHQLPEDVIKGRYAGIVSWFNGEALNAEYREWLYRQINDDVKIAFMGSFGFDVDDEFLQKINLRRVEEKIRHLKKVRFYDEYLGFESKPLIGKVPYEAYQSIHKSNNKTHLKISFGDKEKQYIEPVITGDWGGVAFSPWIIDSQSEGFNYWVLDPFKFFKTALGLSDIPMPDVTTENGRRLWMAHIDGDGFLNRAEMVGTPYSAEVIRDKILKRYSDYPHTVSIIEGEIGKQGLYPEQSEKLENIARDIYKLANVEPASHTFSHPFKWLAIEEKQKSGGGYNLAIKDYKFSFEREVLGSIDYINKNLLADNNAKVFLWSGEALPTEVALKYCYDNGLINMNGGSTTIRKDRASLLFVSPMARTVGDYVQVYAPIMNENVYTNDWTGPFYGFQRVVETFKMTDKPKRLKPIDIYYHFYSGSKPAAIAALYKAYRWTMDKDIFPVYVSEYSPKVIEFRKIVIVRDLNSTLYYSGTHYLRTLRLFPKDKWPSISESSNVVGYRELHDAKYISMGVSSKTILKIKDKESTDIYLLQSNGRINKWEKDDDTILLSLKSHLPLIIEIHSKSSQCKLLDIKNISSKTSKGWRFKLTTREINDARIRCQ